MTRYAEGTSVPTDRTQAELQKLLQRYGADQWLFAWEVSRSVIGFRLAGRQVRIGVEMPTASDPTISETPAGKRRTDLQIQDALAAEERRRWRALFAVIKAKLVAVSDGISTLEREFLADIVVPVPDGGTMTVGEFTLPQIERSYSEGTPPALLPGGGK